MGQARPKYMGWAEPSPTAWAGLDPGHIRWLSLPADVHYARLAWRRKKWKKNEGRKAYLEWRWRRLRRLAAEKRWPAMFLFFFLSSSSVQLPLFSFFFSLSLSLFSVLVSFSSFLFSFLSIVPPPFFWLPLPCFYRRKTGEQVDGAATVLSPLHRLSHMWKAVSVSFWRCRLESWGRWQRKE